MPIVSQSRKKDIQLRGDLSERYYLQDRIDEERLVLFGVEVPIKLGQGD